MKQPCISGSTLKIIGISAMLLDHISAVCILDESMMLSVPPTLVCIIGVIFRLIGRLSFTIFGFLIVEGYKHTHNKIIYSLRILMFAFVSEIPFDLCFFSKPFDFNHQNTLFTLFLGLLSITCLDYFSKIHNNRILLLISSVLFFSIISEILNLDYGFFGIVFISSLYIFKNKKKLRYIISSISLLFCGLGQILGATAFILIELYNGKRGIKIKYIFYLFYPLHFLIIYFIKSGV